MQSGGLREATQQWLVEGCSCILGAADPEQPVSRTRTKSSSCRHDFVATTATCLFPNTTCFINHESIPSPQQSFAQFIKAYPGYSGTLPIDQIRAREYPHLSLTSHVSLDYVGLGLFSHPQLPSSSDLTVTFNPVSLKSQLHHGGQGSELEFSIKKRIMDFLNISENDYTMVFTANRSAAFRLVAESYPFKSSRNLLTVYDHRSEAAEALISSSEKRGARVMAAEFKWPGLRIHSARLRKMIKKKKQRGLFVFPLQSRTSGAAYSYQWMKLAQEHGWHVLLDACALGPKHMDSFGLSLFRPDLLICSFYKVFGENPTGFGCLFVKKSVVPILEASAGADPGIVSIIPGKDGIDNMECRCLEQVDSLGLRVISSRGRYLINWLITALMKLQHPNRLDNFPLVIIYGPRVKFERGAALAFNIHDWKGEVVEPALVQKLADRNYISLGNGYLHHIWFSEDSLVRKSSDHRREIPVVTAALTFLANFEDVYRLWAFIAQFLDADFVEKERWRYTALNQNTVELL
ncbi:hypothetical protein ACS0TY_004442 [Phlomoides rotata]